MFDHFLALLHNVSHHSLLFTGCNVAFPPLSSIYDYIPTWYHEFIYNMQYFLSFAFVAIDFLLKSLFYLLFSFCYFQAFYIFTLVLCFYRNACFCHRKSFFSFAISVHRLSNTLFARELYWGQYFFTTSISKGVACPYSNEAFPSPPACYKNTLNNFGYSHSTFPRRWLSFSFCAEANEHFLHMDSFNTRQLWQRVLPLHHRTLRYLESNYE